MDKIDFSKLERRTITQQERTVVIIPFELWNGSIKKMNAILAQWEEYQNPGACQPVESKTAWKRIKEFIGID